MDELLRNARAADVEDKQLVEALRSVVHHPSYSALLGLYNKRLQGLSEELMAPARSVDGMVAQEFVKGAMFGLILARDLPHIIVESLKAATAEEDDNA